MRKIFTLAMLLIGTIQVSAQANWAEPVEIAAPAPEPAPGGCTELVIPVEVWKCSCYIGDIQNQTMIWPDSDHMFSFAMSDKSGDVCSGVVPPNSALAGDGVCNSMPAGSPVSGGRLSCTRQTVGSR